MSPQARLRVGDWVEVRTRDEILATLDMRGQLDGLPFMPQMFGYCGQRFRVFKRAHKTCDTVFPVRSRRMSDAVHLETRCDGEAFGGCQAGCLLFWKTAWLRKVDGDEPSATSRVAVGTDCTEQMVRDATVDHSEGHIRPRYVCQATRLPYATEQLRWWDVRQYVEDLASGNVTFRRLCAGLVYSATYSLSIAGIGLGKLIRAVYDLSYPLWGGYPFPRRTGRIPVGQPTPTCVLDLQPGELVQVKSHGEILRTLDEGSRNRGLYYDAEAVPFSGKQFRVLRRVERLIDERTGELLYLKNPSVILDGVYCEGRYSYCRMFCPRAIYPYWREIWLRRVGERLEVDVHEGCQQAALPQHEPKASAETTSYTIKGLVEGGCGRSQGAGSGG